MLQLALLLFSATCLPFLKLLQEAYVILNLSCCPFTLFKLPSGLFQL